MDISATSQVTLASSTPPSATTASSSSEFSTLLATSLAASKADYVSGRLGIDLDSRGQPAKVLYFDESGQKLKTSTFTAENILKYTQQYGIDLGDLSGLGEQLDAAGIGYRPYELYKGTGSDHGVDFADLISGGLGSAYDWREDANVAEKGPLAAAQLAAAQALSDALGLTLNAEVTQNRGIDPAYFTPLSAGSETPRTQVMFNGKVAAWYATATQAAAAATQYGGSVIDLTQADSDDASAAATVAGTSRDSSDTVSAADGAAALATTDSAASGSTAATGTTEATASASAASDVLASQLLALIQASGTGNGTTTSALDTLIASLTALRQSS